jgi:hypothetical protein
LFLSIIVFLYLVDCTVYMEGGWVLWTIGKESEDGHLLEISRWEWRRIQIEVFQQELEVSKVEGSRLYQDWKRATYIGFNVVNRR